MILNVENIGKIVYKDDIELRQKRKVIIMEAEEKGN